ncbi:cell wall protein PhiA [Aspergillus mulundensis]|uniref:Cell wall protein phiA n=1 Tax=Aspergillus mulundensis TaxID=1810919 RepID=A0A3D8R3R3_9EURO|nr:Cell wall protein phiA [Aspergillus mulundensis]RDW68692.1 Cell wall protein phiA [Aspergillus mulundensis]
MKFTSVAAVASLAAAASAAPSTPETFGLVAIRSGDAVQYSGFNAAKGSLFAGLPKQNATCEGTDDGFATFYIKDGGLYLYGTDETQQFYVDRSGMGQGKIGYTTGDSSSAPRNGELTGWSIDKNNHLVFDGSSPIACPNSIDGAYSIWASAGVANPAGNSDCVGIAARVEKSDSPVACTYSS